MQNVSYWSAFWQTPQPHWHHQKQVQYAYDITWQGNGGNFDHVLMSVRRGFPQRIAPIEQGRGRLIDGICRISPNALAWENASLNDIHPAETFWTMRRTAFIVAAIAMAALGIGLLVFGATLIPQIMALYAAETFASAMISLAFLPWAYMALAAVVASAVGSLALAIVAVLKVREAGQEISAWQDKSPLDQLSKEIAKARQTAYALSQRQALFQQGNAQEDLAVLKVVTSQAEYERMIGRFLNAQGDERSPQQWMALQGQEGPFAQNSIRARFPELLARFRERGVALLQAAPI